MSEQAAAEQQAAPEGEQPAQESGSLLNAAPAEGETIQLAEGEWLYGAEIKGVGDKPDWFKSDKYKTVEAQAEAYTALESKFGSFTGAPESYELNLPEGFEGEFDKDDPMLIAGMEFAKKTNMNQEGFDDMVGLWINGSTESPKQAQATMATQLVEVLGDNHAQRISQVSGALSNMLDAETYKEIEPFANTPGAIRLVEAVILATAPKVAPIDGGTNPEGFTMEGLNKLRNERYSDGPNKGQLIFHKDQGKRKEIEAYSKALHGEG